jgi:O-antigen/teichoic acid export membrane protein
MNHDPTSAMTTCLPSEGPARSILSNVVLNFLGIVLPFPVMILSVPFLVHRLGREPYGLLSLVGTTLAFLVTLDLGLGRAVTHFAADNLQRRDRSRTEATLTILLKVSAAIGLALAICVGASIPYLTRRLALMSAALPVDVIARVLWLLVLEIPITLLRSAFGGVLEAGHRFDLVNLLKAPSVMLTYLLPVLTVLAGGNLVAAVGSLVLKDLLFLLLTIGAARRVLAALPTDSDSTQSLAAGTVLTYAGWLLMMNIASCLTIFSERFVLSLLCPLGVLTSYSVPNDLVNRFQVVPGAVMSVLFPAFSAHSEAGAEEIDRLFWRGMRGLCLVVGFLAISLSFFSPEILHCWMGSEFKESVPILRLAAFSFFCGTISWNLSWLLQAVGQMRAITLLTLALTPVHLILTVLLVLRFGILGAAVAVAIARVMAVCFFFRLAVSRAVIRPMGAFGNARASEERVELQTVMTRRP